MYFIVFSIEFLFLDASARNDMKYTIYFYDICSNDTRPQMWIGEGQNQYVATCMYCNVCVCAYVCML